MEKKLKNFFFYNGQGEEKDKTEEEKNDVIPLQPDYIKKIIDNKEIVIESIHFVCVLYTTYYNSSGVRLGLDSWAPFRPDRSATEL